MLLDGRTVANHLLEDLADRVHILFGTHGITPHLAVVRVGDNPETTSYITQKEKKGKEVGVVVSVYNHPDNVSQKALQQSIDFLQNDETIHGIILQLPIPQTLNSKLLINSIKPEKDVDGFSENSPFPVPLAAAIIKLLEIPMIKETRETGNSFNEWLMSKNIVVMGKGATGGQPIIDALKERGVDPVVIDSATKNPEELTQKADIIITAVGKRGVLTKNMIKKDAILLNVGMTRGDDDKLYGDYDEEDVKDIAGWFTPTPGGVGPVNVACLLENVIVAAENSVKN